MDLKKLYNCNPTIYETQEFIDSYVFERRSRSAIKNKLLKQYNLQSESPLVRAFLIFLYFKRNNNNNIINEKRVVEESEEESEEEEEEGTIVLKKPPVKTPVSKTEMERFTKKDFIESIEYKYFLEHDNLPEYIKNAMNSDNVFWEGQYNNLKTSYKNLKNI